jgi:immunoglobulin-binding protein 1
MAQGFSGPRDPALRREAKIKQYRREKELRAQISVSCELLDFRGRRVGPALTQQSGLPTHPESSSHPVQFLISLLPSPSNRPSVTVTSSATSSTSVNPNDGTESRSTMLLLLRLLHTLSLASLSSINMELELLASAPASISELDPSSAAAETPDEREASRSAAAQDDTWRLDRTLPSRVQPRELISGGGRVLRPFTILPSTQAMSDRERLKGDVFKQSWRLPTMTIDEYLEEEQRRGGIISGGG